ncbi:MAG: aminotransferase class V-fold PLP-dependent enzyme [Terriglobales bacterium]
MSDSLSRFRPEFPILATTTYMISNSLGAMPRRAEDALLEYTHTWKTRGVRAWKEQWWELALEVGNEIGVLMNAPPDTIATFQNVTTAEAVVASCFDFNGKRNKIVYDDLNFPSVMYFWEAQRLRGARVHMVGPQDGIHVATEKLLDAIDEETLLVPISHVIFRSAFIQDVAAIVEKAHRVGAYVVLDSFHALGVVPFDVQELNVDFVVGGVLKWLCGGPGTAYLYVQPDLAANLTPGFTGWMAHQAPFSFEIGPNRFTTGPYKFMNGTPNVAALYAARPGLKIIREAGIENIRQKSRRQTARLIELADARGWPVNTPRNPDQRGGTVSIDMPNSKQVCAELLKRDVLVDWRPNAGVRLSPHFYNSHEELDRAIAAIEEILTEMGVPGR